MTCSKILLIEHWKNKAKKSNRGIAKLLSKTPYIINNEIKRDLVDLSFNGAFVEYSADMAQNHYDWNRMAFGKTSVWSPEKDEIIRAGILNKLSPEVISQKKGMPCFSTIYSWIEKGWIKGICKKDLIYPRKRKKTFHKKTKDIRKRGGLSIDLRPKVIENREEVGHFEIDLVILNKTKGEQLLTLTDRKTRYEIVRLIKDKRAESVHEVLKKLSKQYNFKSITADNGSEFMRLEEVMDCPIYYAHPYSSYERGTNENANRMIRRWLPKGTQSATAKAVADIESWMNHYPRKMFNYKCPLDLPEVANLFL
ncbi:IS30 family transposase [Peptoniphilus rhinitidis]|uniref:IS30 family transposase n=1 Tax=Peptoniphilus rhinitidis TaxID=1175452 RepID=UPI002904241D|nr:IS30 family transposase [Peptoniphilus rhinitidis]MDU1044045.1 IS30 family transposase [Peptoniphilus rhinitidis]